jgi:hypothetical protein
MHPCFLPINFPAFRPVKKLFLLENNTTANLVFNHQLHHYMISTYLLHVVDWAEAKVSA